MNQLSLASALELKQPAVIAFCGGGGKTSLIFAYAKELTRRGEKVLITTTTKIFPFAGIKTYRGGEDKLSAELLEGCFREQKLLVAGFKINQAGKIEGYSPQAICKLKNSVPCYILIEADGAKGRPLKGHAAFEPVLPACTDITICVAGYDIVGAKIDETNIHRAEIFKKTVLKDEQKTKVDEALLARAFAHMIKLSKKQAPGSRPLAVLNKVDLLKSPFSAAKIASFLFAEGHYATFLGTMAKAENPVQYYFSRHSKSGLVKVTAVLLAAGQAKRMGTDKLALPFKGHTVLEETLARLTKAPLDEIIVVTRPGGPWQHLARPGRIKVVVNEHFKKGQATSLVCGLKAVSPATQGVLFALGDQPEVSEAVYNKLLSAYLHRLKKVTLPLYCGQRGNPVIFDRTLWPELFSLSGDVGGRMIIGTLDENDLCTVPVEDPAVIFDLDTPQDYTDLNKRRGF